MSRKLLLRIAAVFVFMTFAGHTMGAIQGPPVEQEAVHTLYQQMQQTMVTFPMGAPKSVATLMLGANYCLSVYLFIAGALFVMLSSSPSTREDRFVLINSAGMAATAVISLFCFFPMPAACTGLAALLGFAAVFFGKSSAA